MRKYNLKAVAGSKKVGWCVPSDEEGKQFFVLVINGKGYGRVFYL